MGYDRVDNIEVLAGTHFASPVAVHYPQPCPFVSQDNRCKYPTIAWLEMDILAIQGLAVPCEHVFSSAKETMTSR
ncbi:hypothetical protein FA15DRAFT_604674 [Coprinopsis marcescibilis]|uniref:HAT C-terminal dimerisation domain-containing protein n=1 Tax=Coprinopsis marcescibilis TaxID=230819 RepID=A0A5C3KCE0_COPMA|nr:hypothetical protein FA15DRAFT_604674 [Coprinopsis marcescibilis]